MNIHHIYYAAEVARYGSINKAASCLFISQSALSRSIKELEEELGFQLFIRTPNGVLPTHQGQEFLRRAQRLNDQYIALREQYYTNQQLPVVQLSFAAIRCVIVELLLIQLYRRYQDRQYLNLCVCEERVGKVIDYVYDGLYSVGLILVEESQREAVLQKCRRRDLAWVPVSKHPVYLQVGTGHPLADRTEVSLSELAPYPRMAMVQDEFETTLYGSHIRGYDPGSAARRIVINDKSTMYALLTGTDAYYVGLDLTNLRRGNSDVRYLPIRDLQASYELVFIHLRQHALTAAERELLADIRSLASSAR